MGVSMWPRLNCPVNPAGGLPWNYGILHTSYTDHSIGSTTFHCHINHAGFTRTHRLNFELHWRQPLLYVSSVIGKIDHPDKLIAFSRVRGLNSSREPDRLT